MRFGMLFPWAALLVIVTAGVLLWRQSIVMSDLESRWQEAYDAQAERARRANALVVTANDRIKYANSVIQERNDRLGSQDATLGYLSDRVAVRDGIIASQRDTIIRLSTPPATYMPYPTATPRPTYTRYPTPRPTPRRSTRDPAPTPLPRETISIYEGIKVYSDDSGGRGFILTANCKDYLVTAAHVVGNSRELYIEYPAGNNIGWKPVTFKYPDQDLAMVDVTDEFVSVCAADGYWGDDALGHILAQGEITSYKTNYNGSQDCPLVATDIITTDAPAYSGYSGSPVLDSADYHIGILVCGDADSSVVVTWDVIEGLLP